MLPVLMVLVCDVARLGLPTWKKIARIQTTLTTLPTRRATKPLIATRPRPVPNVIRYTRTYSVPAAGRVHNEWWTDEIAVHTRMWHDGRRLRAAREERNGTSFRRLLSHHD